MKYLLVGAISLVLGASGHWWISRESLELSPGEELRLLRSVVMTGMAPAGSAQQDQAKKSQAELAQAIVGRKHCGDCAIQIQPNGAIRLVKGLAVPSGDSQRTPAPELPKSNK
jgi:hypothetical protein